MREPLYYLSLRELDMSDRYLPPLLRLERVSLQATVGSALLLQDISLSIQPGEKVGIVGVSGAGKTTLLRLLNRLVSPTQGKIYVNSALAEDLGIVQLRRTIVLSTQEPKLMGMTVKEALSYPLRLQQLSEPEIGDRFDTWTNLLRIPAEWFNQTELQLSLGQRQLVAIARALMMQPQVILLDEPTSALDLGTANHLLAVLNELNQSQNLTVVIVNHQLELIKDFCDRLLLIEGGILAEDVPATESNWQRLTQKIVQLQLQEEDWLN